MAKHHMKLIEDYEGDKVRTIQILFFEESKTRKKYGGDPSQIPFKDDAVPGGDHWWRAGRIFILDKVWPVVDDTGEKKEQRYVGFYIVWQNRNYANYNVLYKPPTAQTWGTAKAQQIIMDIFKKRLSVDQFNRFFLAEVYFMPK
jgi:hypothetical protein